MDLKRPCPDKQVSNVIVVRLSKKAYALSPLEVKNPEPAFFKTLAIPENMFLGSQEIWALGWDASRKACRLYSKAQNVH